MSGCIGGLTNQPTDDGEADQDEGLTNEMNDSEISVEVSGVVSQRPYSLSNPTVEPQDIGNSQELYASPIFIKEIKSGPEQLEAQTVIAEYRSVSPTLNNSAPYTGDVVKFTGVYNTSSHRIVISTKRGEDNLSVVGNSSNYQAPPVIGTEGEEINVTTHTFTEDARSVEIISHRGKTIKLVDNNTARIVEGEVRYGEAFSQPFEGIVVEVTEKPD